MTAKRVEMHRLQEFVRLHRLGTKSVREIARLLKMGRTTEWSYRKALTEAGLLAGDPEKLPDLAELKAAVASKAPTKTPRQQVSRVEPWRPQIEAMAERGAGPRAIYDRLRMDHGDEFVCSESAVKRFCARLRAAKGVQPEDVVIRVETAPGEVAQVDFGYVGKIYDPDRGVRRKLWVFVMTLGHSRRMFAHVTFDQRIETWIECHTKAFDHFGGVVETVVPDNLKAAVIRCAFGVDSHREENLNRSYIELARHYGFTIDPTPPRAPEKKGKVESDVKYVKRNFFLPRDLDELGIDGVRRELTRWLEEVADRRTHGTIQMRPIECFDAVERQALRDLPITRYEPVVWKKAKVHPDSHVVFGKRMYSVPFGHIGDHVWIRGTSSSVCVYANDKRVATHKAVATGQRSTNAEHLPETRRDWRHRSNEYWMPRAHAIGPDAASLVQAIFESEGVASKLRVVQSIVTHLEKHPPERANAASRRALQFHNLTFACIRDILRKGLDLAPDPNEQPSFGKLETPRFARSADQPVQRHLTETTP